MGVHFSCPLAVCSDVENAFESVVVKSISFGDDNEAKTPLRSVNFGSQDSEPKILQSSGSGRMILERSVSFKGNELERLISSVLREKEKDDSLLSFSMDRQSPTAEKYPMLDPCNPKHQAAIKLQKVYKSFRTRRKLADCAVLVEQSWWKLLDFAELKHSSISFFDIAKHESAISRWSRARTRAAKVGKGLSKNDKAQKLALQHWLEAIDPRHRYGHNLHFYYVQWLHSKSREPFFYWLDIGEGKEVNLEKCPRSKLQQQCIKYLGPMERKAYEVVIEGGKFIYRQSGELLHTTEDEKWIFVLSTSKTLYVGKKKKGTFQHSSFLAGGVTLAAGRIIVESGILKAVWPHSGHYQPTEENFRDFLGFLRENNVDLANVEMSPMDDDESSAPGQINSKHIRNNSSEEDLIQTINDLITEETHPEDLSHANIHSLEEGTSARAVSTNHKSERLHNFGRTLTTLEIPKREELLERVESNPIIDLSAKDVSVNPSTDDGCKSAEGEENEGGVLVPEEAIFQRISSKRRTESYQLGKKLSCKWTTGAGPRIGCVRDYPPELQFQALEQVSLSPRSVDRLNKTGALTRRCSTPDGFGAEAALLVTSPMLAR